jgi:hypothetical protein
MRSVILVLTIAVFSTTLAMTGCGPANTDPKAVNVKEDSRIKRDTEGGVNKTQTNIPAK